MFNEKNNNLDEASFIKEVKNYIKDLNFEDSEKICELNLSLEKIIDIISLLVGEKENNWLVLSSKESTSISSYLYYMQNKRA